MPKISMASPASASDEDLNTRKLMQYVSRSLIKISVMSSACAVVAVVTLLMVLPLKQSVPYEVEVNKNTGEVSIPANQMAVKFTPQWVNSAFFLRRWVEDLFTINQYLTVSIDDPRAQEFLRGDNAIAEYKAFRDSDKTFDRLAANPSLVRSVDVESITPVAGTKNGAIAQVQLTTHNGGITKVEDVIVTIYYVFLPTQDQASLRKNPISIFVTDFKISAGGSQDSTP